MAYDAFFLTYKSDKETNLRFAEIQERYPNFQLVKFDLEVWSGEKIIETVSELVHEANTKFFWVVDPDVLVDPTFDFDYRPEEGEDAYSHLWNASERDTFLNVVGVKLLRKIDVTNRGQPYVNDLYHMCCEFKEHETDKVSYSPSVQNYDIFYWEKNYGRENLELLRARHPNVIAVQAINARVAHKICKQQSTTDFYYFITPETQVFESFKFDYQFEERLKTTREKLVLWQKLDQYNEPFEYHGIGLFPKQGGLLKSVDYDKFLFGDKAVYETVPAAKDFLYPVFYVEDVNEFQWAATDVDTQMYWVVDKAVEPYLDKLQAFVPPNYDRAYIHNFNIDLGGGKVVRNGVRLIPKGFDINTQKDMPISLGKLKPLQRIAGRTIAECLPQLTGRWFWMVNPDLDLTVSDEFFAEWFPDLYAVNTTHIWKFNDQHGDDCGYGGVAFSNSEYDQSNVSYVDQALMKIPNPSRIKVLHGRENYRMYQEAKGEVFYWTVDSIVETLPGFNFNFYPDIHSIENVFAFRSQGNTDSGVYLIHRPHLERYSPSEQDFSYDSFQNIIRINKAVSRTIAHPVYYFDDGYYKENRKRILKDPTIEIIDATDLAAAYQEAAAKTHTGYFWAISSDIQINRKFDRAFYVDKFHKSYFHVWPKTNPHTGYIHEFGGLTLVPAEAIKALSPDENKLRKMNFKYKKPMKDEESPAADIPYDIVFLSYNEPFADENYAKLRERFPLAKRVHGVKGIFNAHKRAAELADTNMFYVVDADAILIDEFQFEYFPSVWDQETVHVWKSQNPINDLVYGYGGLKLFPTRLLRNAKDWHIDFTTSVSDKFKSMPIAANYTAFNTDPFNTWKSAFRECVKLSSSVIRRTNQDETKERLEIWCSRGEDRDFGSYAIAGATEGRNYGLKYYDNSDELNKINDFDWLKEMFEQTVKGKLK